MLAPINTSFGNRIGRFTTIYFNDKAYVLAGVARNEKEAEAYDRYFLETAQSFHAMTEDERSLARPLQLKITHVDSNASFSTLAGQSPLETYPEEQLRLLNNMFPEGHPGKTCCLKSSNNCFPGNFFTLS